MWQRVAAVVALVVVSAGCAGLAGGPDGGDSRTVNPSLRGTPTETPSPTPVSTPTSGLPPGVSTDGVDAVRLVDAHRQALSNQSFTTVRTRTVRTPDGESFVSETMRLRVDGSAEFARWTFRRSGFEGYRRNQTAAYWTNGSVSAQRTTGENRSANVTRGVPSPAWMTDLTGVRTTYVLLARFDPTVGGTVTADGRELTVLRADELRMFVAPDGAVVAYRLDYRATRYGREVRVVERFGLADVGNTTVERPPWAVEALADGRPTNAGTATDPDMVTAGTPENGTTDS